MLHSFRVIPTLRLIVFLAVLVSACHRGTEPPEPLSSVGLAGDYRLIQFVPNPATTGSLVLRPDSTYVLSLDPWPVHKYLDGCTLVNGTNACVDDAESDEVNPDFVGARNGTWRYEGGDLVSLHPRGAVDGWGGTIEGPDLVFDSGFYPSATFRKK